MGNLHSLLRRYWDDAPRNWSAGLQPGAINVFLPRRTWRSWSSALRFMESLHSLLRMHWDHEPTPNPSQEGNGQNADRCLFPSWEGSGVGRFMESLHSLLRMHWDHEPTPNPSQEGNGQDADRCLFPSWEGSGVGRFMERLAGANLGTGWVGWLHCRMACMDGAALFRPGIHISWQTALRLATRQRFDGAQAGRRKGASR